MRLLHVINSLDPKLGGTVEVVRAFANEQTRQGLMVDVLTLEAPERPWFSRIAAPVIALGPSKLGLFSYNNRLMNWLRAHRDEYDAIILHGMWDYTCLGGLRGLRDGATAWFLYPHGMLDPWFEGLRLKHIKKTFYWKLWGQHILREADGVIFTAEDEQLLALTSFQPFAVRGMVATLGTDAPDPDGALYRALFFETYPQLVGKQLAIFLGRNHPKKGLELLVSALGNLAAQYPGLQVVIAGPEDDGQRAILEAQAAQLGVADRILWTGFVSDELRAGARYSGGVFVLSSHSENFGLSVVESLACGQPVLITDKVNIWREIDRYGAALVGSDTVADTTASLKRYLDMPEAEFAQMQQSARRCFEECFYLPVVTQRLTEMLQQRIAERRATAK
jgi:glycosyltransferase involved in cell wall biosynthesis